MKRPEVTSLSVLMKQELKHVAVFVEDGCGGKNVEMRVSGFGIVRTGMEGDEHECDFSERNAEL